MLIFKTAMAVLKRKSVTSEGVSLLGVPIKIIEEARRMIADGYKDITLLGQNVNSYGKDREDGVTFAELLRKLNDLEGDFVIARLANPTFRSRTTVLFSLMYLVKLSFPTE